MKKSIYIKIDEWVKDILVDPLSKEKLNTFTNSDYIISSYGRQYPINEGIYDLRLLKNQTTPDQILWRNGQEEYESLVRVLECSDDIDYDAELKGLEEVYKKIPIIGDCLDVGGNQGKLRAFLNAEQKYISCDPFINVFDSISKKPNLKKTYKFIEEPVNFICCDAEFLPFKSLSFDIVHMRSVIDHFLNPELALNEAYRVLKNNGTIIIGLYVHGGKSGKETILQEIKEGIKHILPYFGITKYIDPHVWHPTYEDLIELIENCGFTIDKVHWQEETNDSVCYIRALKKSNFSR